MFVQWWMHRCFKGAPPLLLLLLPPFRSSLSGGSVRLPQSCEGRSDIRRRESTSVCTQSSRQKAAANPAADTMHGACLHGMEPHRASASSSHPHRTEVISPSHMGLKGNEMLLVWCALLLLDKQPKYHFLHCSIYFRPSQLVFPGRNDSDFTFSADSARDAFDKRTTDYYSFDESYNNKPKHKLVELYYL